MEAFAVALRSQEKQAPPRFNLGSSEVLRGPSSRPELLRHKINKDPDPFGLILAAAVQGRQRKRHG